MKCKFSSRDDRCSLTCQIGIKCNGEESERENCPFWIIIKK